MKPRLSRPRPPWSRRWREGRLFPPAQRPKRQCCVGPPQDRAVGGLVLIRDGEDAGASRTRRTHRRFARHLTRTAAHHPEHALLLSADVRWSLCPGLAGPTEGQAASCTVSAGQESPGVSPSKSGLADNPAVRVPLRVLSQVRMNVPRRQQVCGDVGERDLLESHWAPARLSLKIGGMHLRYPCVCCGHLTLSDGPGSHQICPVCFWEDDVMQLRWPDRASGANRASLLDAQQDFIALGACEERFLEHVRPPDGDEPLDPNWRPIDLSRDRFESRAARLAAWPDDRTVLYWWRYRDSGFWRRL